MSRALSRRATRAVAGALACLSFAAHAGSLTVRDADAGGWAVTEDPAQDAPGFLLRHLGPDNRPDPRFGRAGQTSFSITANNDAPISVRVDATHRVWMVGAGISGNQPQPVVERFTADGNLDLRWGVQGKVQLSPNGLAIEPKDLLPLADGSVLVAGETTGTAVPRAVVFHLHADGRLDLGFGAGGVWQRAGDGDASSATSLAASADGVAAAAVVVRGAKPGEELWSLNDKPPTLIHHQPLEDNTDGDDVRVTWAGDHWSLASGGGPTAVVPAALLSNRPGAPASAPAAVANASSDPGPGSFNPFEDTAASAPTSSAAADDGLPWTAIGVGVVVLAGAGVAFAMRRRAPKTVLKAGRGAS
jgi:hypothetical protein